MRLSVRLMFFCLSLLSLPALAAPVAGLYQVREAVADQQPESRDAAMQKALQTLVQRLTGDAKAAQSSALESLRKDPQQIVSQYGYEDDVLVVTKLDRLARSITDAHSIAAEIEQRGASLSLAGSTYDSRDPMGKMLFSMLATFAEFEADVASQRTKEGLAIARAKGRLNGKPPKLSKRQHLKVLEEFESGDVTVGDLAEDYGVDRATIYRTVNRAKKMRAESQ